MNIIHNGHSRVEEKKTANWLYISIGIVVVAAFILIFTIEGRFANPFVPKNANREAADQVK